MDSFTSFIKNEKFKIFILVIFCLLLFLPSALNRDLHYRDELRYVEVAREMITNNQWLVPHFGGEIYSDKPPVYFWVLNLSKTIFSNYSTIAVVLPSVISSIIIILLTSYLAKLIFGNKYSLLGGLILATSLLFFGLSIFARMDLMMIVFITAALISFYLGYIKEKLLKQRYYFLLFLLMGVATVIKGPAGFLVPLVVIPVFLTLEKNLAELKQMNLLKGFVLFLVVVLAWIIPAVISGGQNYAYQLLIVQTLGRSVNSFAHQQPLYFYFPRFLLTFSPWSIFLVTSFIYLLKKRGQLSREVKFLLSWFWVPFLLFSLISGKLDIYLLPIYPAASLLVVFLFKNTFENKKKYFLIVPAIITFILFIVIALMIPKIAEGVALKSLLTPAIIILILASISGFVILYKKKLFFIPYLIVFIAFSFLFNFSVSVVPPLSQTYTKRPIASKIGALKAEKNLSNIIAYKYGEPESLTVYTGFFIHNIGNQNQMLKYLNKNKKVLILVAEDDWQNLNKNLSLNFLKKYSSNGYLLIYKK